MSPVDSVDSPALQRAASPLGPPGRFHSDQVLSGKRCQSKGLKQNQHSISGDCPQLPCGWRICCVLNIWNCYNCH